MKRVFWVLFFLMAMLSTAGCYHRTLVYTDYKYGVVKGTIYTKDDVTLTLADANGMNYSVFYNTYPKHYNRERGESVSLNSRICIEEPEEHTYHIKNELYEKWKGTLSDATKVLLYTIKGSDIQAITDDGGVLADAEDYDWKKPYLFELAPNCTSYSMLNLPVGAEFSMSDTTIEYRANFQLDSSSAKLTLLSESSLLRCYGISFSEKTDSTFLYVTDGNNVNGMIQFHKDGTVRVYNIGGSYTFTDDGVEIQGYLFSGGLQYYITAYEDGDKYIVSDEMNAYYTYNNPGECPFYDLYTQGNFTTKYVWDGSKLVADGFITATHTINLVLAKESTIWDEKNNETRVLPAGSVLHLEKYGVKDNLMYFQIDGQSGTYHCAYAKGLLKKLNTHL